MSDEYTSVSEEYFASADFEYSERPEEYSKDYSFGQAQPVQEKQEQHARRKRFLMSLCSAAAIVMIAVAAIPGVKEVLNVKTERQINIDYQFRTMSHDDEPGLYLDGVRVSSSETKNARRVLEIYQEETFESLMYPAVNGERMQDRIVLPEEIEILDEEGYVKRLRWMVEFSAPGFQFQPNFYANGIAREAIAFYQGKCVALVSIHRIPGRNVTEKTASSLQEAYEIRVRGWPDANTVTEEGTEAAAELLKSLIQIQPVEVTQNLVLGDSLKITINENTRINDGIMMPNTYALVRSTGTYYYCGFGFTEVKDMTLSNAKLDDTVLHVYLPIRPRDDEYPEVPLYELIYTEEDLASGVTSYETVNGIRWRIFRTEQYLDCFCEEEPNLLFRMEMWRTNKEDVAFENLLQRLQQIEKYE